MAAVKEAEETVQLTKLSSRRRSLLLFASFLAIVCAAVAFTLLIVKDHGRPRLMVHDQTAPATHSVVVLPKPDAATRASVAAAAGASHRPFHLDRNARGTVLGPLRVRLTRTDPRSQTYDLLVVSGRRSYRHRRLKEGATVSISLGVHKGFFKLATTAMDKNSVDGYWMVEEPGVRRP